MAETYTKHDLIIAREVGIDDVITFLNLEKFDSISEKDAVALAGELLKDKKEILGCANKLIPTDIRQMI